MAHNREDIYKLIKVLSDGNVHSGESLGDVIGVTRAAVWKRLQRLQQLGLTVESVRGQGYRLPGGCDLLDLDSIQPSLSRRARSLVGVCKVFFELPSTNEYLLRETPVHGAVCLAEQQTAGRGRRGRVWSSPFAANIYLSVRWHFNQGVQALEGLSLAVGVAVARALESLGLQAVQLKWPNDILCNQKKLGGVLIEVGGDLNGDCAAIVGVGLNVAMPAESGAAIGQPWTDLTGCGLKVSRNEVAARLMEELLSLLSGYQEMGFGPLRQAWMDRAAYVGERVTVRADKDSREGVFCGIDEHGALGFEVDGVVEWLSGGEVSVRSEVVK